MSNPPTRRLELTLSVSADSWSELVGVLEQVSMDVADRPNEQPVDHTSGGVSSGYHLAIELDEGQDADTFQMQLAAWVADRRAARARQAHQGISAGSDPTRPVLTDEAYERMSRGRVGGVSISGLVDGAISSGMAPGIRAGGGLVTSITISGLPDPDAAAAVERQVLEGAISRAQMMGRS